MIKQTKKHRDAAVYILTAENNSNSEQERAGISHGEDCCIQTEKKSQSTIISLEIDGVRKQLRRPKMSVIDFFRQTSARLHFTCYMIKSGPFSALTGRIKA